jgi:hypothetical protein
LSAAPKVAHNSRSAPCCTISSSGRIRPAGSGSSSVAENNANGRVRDQAHASGRERELLGASAPPLSGRQRSRLWSNNSRVSLTLRLDKTSGRPEDARGAAARQQESRPRGRSFAIEVCSNFGRELWRSAPRAAPLERPTGTLAADEGQVRRPGRRARQVVVVVAAPAACDRAASSRRRRRHGGRQTNKCKTRNEI